MPKSNEVRYRRRLSESRGTVMLEFALITPLFLMIAMFVIEMLQYHDASLMADHTAWRLARIASVRTNLKGEVKMPEWKKYKAQIFVATMLMSTATPGWGNEEKLLSNLIGEFFAKKKEDGSKDTGSLGYLLGSGITDFLLEKTGILSSIKTWIDKTMGSQMLGRYPVLMAKAFSRLLEKDVLTIKTEKIGELKYPLITTDKKKEPSVQPAYLVTVSLNYPMRNGWLYQYFSLQDGGDNERPSVFGRAMMLAETRIDDVKVYEVDPKKRPNDFSVIIGLIRKLIGFSKIKDAAEKKGAKKARELRAKASKLEGNIQVDKVKLEALNVKLKSLQDARQALQNELDEQVAYKKKLENRRQELKASSDPESRKELSNIEFELKKTNSRIKELNNSIAKKDQEILDPKREAEKTEKHLKSQEAELKKLKAPGEKIAKEFEKSSKAAQELLEKQKKNSSAGSARNKKTEMR